MEAENYAAGAVSQGGSFGHLAADPAPVGRFISRAGLEMSQVSHEAVVSHGGLHKNDA